MENEYNISIPDELITGRNVEITFISEIKNNLGILGLSEQTDAYVLHLYRLFYNESNQKFEPIQQLEAFQFQTPSEMHQFIDNLPNISALDMILLMNPTTPPRKPFSFLM
ncbi:hypothetical protein [Oceanobacillus iheyensis HTE831]|uniref:Uncharacterized protein n=1 Tax=Oceanobacillus iheyensis (strain DSM 14371 / CIP 107618 / JCM 11309 / KCTC 3954 / HTE831) TaxID=221109 RepID=Q8EL99_OCEIH|nr:hypothetical protein [Oceanobacillus iheyensis]BAC15288.1 hypothetical protein [Oceanobacillus iheyensis HTE831]